MIKEAIQNKGVSISNTDSFRSYADKINSIETGTEDISEYFDTSKITVANSTDNILTMTAKKIPSEILQGLSQKNIIDLRNMFRALSNLTSIDLSVLNNSSISSMGGMCYNCNQLETIDFGENFDTSNVTDIGTAFYNCQNLITLPKFDAKKVTSVGNVVYNTNLLENFGGLENLGMAYDATQPANYFMYKLDLHYSIKLSHESLTNVINNLYNIATKGCKTQSLQLGETNIAKLSEEEIAIATSKGWTVS